MDMHSQKYNPEVPMEASTFDNNNGGLHKINDQLITMKNIVNKQVNLFSWPHDTIRAEREREFTKWTN
jgi:hypothetical protein